MLPLFHPIRRLTNQRQWLTCVLIIVLLDATGIGLVLPVMPGMIRDMVGGAPAEAALWLGVTAVGFAVMQILCGPILGALADRAGRRPVLLLALAVMAAGYPVMAISQSPWTFIAARVAGGILAATHATALAFVADISPPDQRARRFALVLAAQGAGLAAGPWLGGHLVELGSRAPLIVAAGLALANFAFAIVVLPESVADAIRRPFELRQSLPLAVLRRIGRSHRLRRFLLLLAGYEGAHCVYSAVWPFFASLHFRWDVTTVQVSMGLIGVGYVAVQALAVGPILRRLGEGGTILFGLWFEVFILIAFGVLSLPSLALILTPLSALGSVALPVLLAQMSKHAGDDVQGELQGIIAATISLVALCAPLLLTLVFFSTSRPDAAIHYPGGVFLLAAGVLFYAVERYLATGKTH